MHGSADFFSLEWWVSVFLVGIALHIIGRRADGWLDRIAGGVSTKWREQRSRRSANWNSRVDALVANDELLGQLQAFEQRCYARAHTIWLITILAVLIVLLPPHVEVPAFLMTALNAISIVGFVFGFVAYVLAERAGDMGSSARARKAAEAQDRIATTAPIS